MLEELKLAKRSKVVGSKQVLKALGLNSVRKVFLARDAEGRITGEILAACQEAGIPVEWAEDMQSLGKSAGIDVGTATAALLKID